MDPHDRTISFGYWLRRHRLARDMTQARLAGLSGCSRAMLRKVEADERRPSAALARSLAAALDLHGEEQRAFLAAARAELSVDRLDLPAAPAAWDDVPGRVPLPPTALLGRADELAGLLRLARDPALRCLTLVGPGGVGKTRLALAAAAALQAERQALVAFVPLAPVTQPDLLLPTVATALGMRPSAPLAPQLRRLGLPALLVLDNLEQLTAAATQISRLLSDVPDLRVLVTSRSPLRIAAERIVELPPLALPPESAERAVSEAELASYPAAALFLDRLAAIQPAARLDAADLVAVAQAVRRLDGLPLAIELAAARCRLLRPRDLPALLGGRLDFLAGGPRDLPARQQTLRRVIGWSYDLVGPDERRTFERLAVFRGGFEVDACAAVDPRPGALARIEALLDSSLVQRAPDRPGRLMMLETIGAFASERLVASGGLADARARHGAWCVALAGRAEAGLRGAGRLSWMDGLEAELHNLRAALEWSIGEGADPAGGLLIAGGLRQFWHVRGRHREGRRWVAAGLALAPMDDAGLRGRALLAEGYLAWFQREYAAAQRALEPAVALLREAGDVSLVEGLALLAMAGASLDGPGPALRALAEEAAQLAAGTGDSWAVGMARFWQGVIAAGAGDGALAERCARESIAAFARSGDAWNGGPHSTLGDLALARGDDAAAREHYRVALECFRVIGDRWGCAFSLRVLAEIALRDRCLDDAAALAGESLALWVALGDERSEARVRRLLSSIERGEARASA